MQKLLLKIIIVGVFMQASIAYGDAVFYLHVPDIDGIDLYYNVSSSKPSIDGYECNNGTLPNELVYNQTKENISAITLGLTSTKKNLFSMGPPFSGSNSRTRYLTICASTGSTFATVVFKLEIKLSGCAAWVCDTKYVVSKVASKGGDITYKLTQDLWGHFYITKVTWDQTCSKLQLFKQAGK